MYWYADMRYIYIHLKSKSLEEPHLRISPSAVHWPPTEQSPLGSKLGDEAVEVNQLWGSTTSSEAS